MAPREIPRRKNNPNIEIILETSVSNNPLNKILPIFSNPPRDCTAEYDNPKIEIMAVLVPKKSDMRALNRSVFRFNQYVAYSNSGME